MPTDALLSGSARLDEALGGGLVANGINLISGPPGTGKTTLAHQYLFANTSADRPGVYYATGELPDEFLRSAGSLSFFDRGRVGESLFYEQLVRGPREGLRGILDEVSSMLLARRPAVVVIDSLKALAERAASPAEWRAFLHGLALRATGLAVAFLWVAEYTEAEVLSRPEAAVADAIVSLGVRPVGSRRVRVIRVLKLRGRAGGLGEVFFRLTGHGIAPFPRLASAGVASPWDDFPEEPTSAGTPPRVSRSAAPPRSQPSAEPIITTIEAGPRAAAQARRLLRGMRTGWFDGEPLEAAVLLLSEMVSNAVRHGSPTGTGIEVGIRLDDQRLTVEVGQGGGFPPVRAPAVGWGLQLVEALADRWGARQQAESAVMWFVIDRRSRRRGRRLAQTAATPTERGSPPLPARPRRPRSGA